MIPVATQIKPPDPNQGLATLSSILGIRQAQQTLQTGQYLQQSAAANAQKDQQAMGERQFLQGMMASGKDDQGNNILNAQGEPDPDKLTAAIGRKMPLTGQPIIQNIIKTQGDKAALSDSLRGLSQNYKNDVSGILRSFMNDPKATSDDVTKAIDNYIKDNPRAAEAGHWATNLIDDHFDKGNPDKKNDMLLHLAQQFQPSATTATQQAPSVATMTAPGGLQAVQTNPLAPGGVAPTGAPIQQGVAPGANLVTDSFGNQFILDPRTNTLRPVGTGGAAGAGSAGKTFKQPVADQPSILAEIRESRAATAQGGITRNVNQHLLDLSSQTRTGPGTQTVQNIAAAIGLPSGSRYQEITAYLDRQAALQAQVMGVPHTNAGMEAASRASGTPEYTPEALQEKVKFFDALNSGAMAYRQGLDKAVGTGPTPDLTKYQAYRGAWAQNFDPDIFRAEDAQRRGDTQELASIRKRLGAQGMKALAQKSANLRMLENGQIPP